MTTLTTARPRVLTAAFWQAAGARALRTVLVAALPFLAPLVGGDWTVTTLGSWTLPHRARAAVTAISRPGRRGRGS